MADVWMEYKGKRKLVPAGKVAVVEKAGGVRIGPDIATGESEGEDDGEGETTPDPARPRAEGAPLIDIGETANDTITGLKRGITLGFNDTLEGVYNAVKAMPSGGKKPLREAYDEGVAKERAKDEAARKRSPLAVGRGELAGTIATLVPATAALAPAAAAGSGAPIMGALPQATTALARAAPTAARFATGAGLGALTQLGLQDATMENAPKVAAEGAAMGLAGEALLPLLPAAGSAAMSTAKRGAGGLRTFAADVVDRVIEAGGVRPAIGKAVDEATVAVAKKAASRLRPPAPEATASPAPELGEEELARILQEMTPPPTPAAPVKAPPAPAPMPAPMTAPAPVSAPRAPDPLQQLAPAAPAIVPAVTRNSSAGQIAKAVEAKAVELGTTDLATIANALKLPTTIVSDPLKNAVQRFAFREAVRLSPGAPRAPMAPVTDPLDEMSKRLIREGNSRTTNTNPVALTDDVTRTPKVVAAVGQQERWRGIYDSLTPDQRASYIEQLRRESGLTDDQIRRRLKLTMAEWRRKSFTR